MSKFTVTHEIHCDAETFWKTFFDKTFNEKLYRDALGFPQYEILEQRDTDGEIRRRVSGQPKMDMPGPVLKLLGSSFRYIEDGVFDKARKVYSWKTTPSALADKLRQDGSVRIEPAGEGKVRRIADMLVEAKIFGLGGLIESSTEKQLREGWDKSAAFMNQYLKSPH